MSELSEKLSRLHQLMQDKGYSAIHFAKASNLSWLLCGADLMVSLIDEPVAELIVTKEAVVVIASNIEQGRLEEEELPEGIELSYLPWHDPEAKKQAVMQRLEDHQVLSDTEASGFDSAEFWPLRVPLVEAEIGRYRALGQNASTAMTDVLMSVKPGITEQGLAGRLADALYAKGIQVVVMLVAGDERLRRFKHPLPKNTPIQDRGMAVICARRQGLVANLSRLFEFKPLSAKRKKAYGDLLKVEQAIFDEMQQTNTLDDIFLEIKRAYAKIGQANHWKAHHQGGPTGYNTRDFLLTPKHNEPIVKNSAYAWNPSLPGLKVEDTVILTDRIDILTADPRWPMLNIGSRKRPDILVP